MTCISWFCCSFGEKFTMQQVTYEVPLHIYSIFALPKSLFSSCALQLPNNSSMSQAYCVLIVSCDLHLGTMHYELDLPCPACLVIANA